MINPTQLNESTRTLLDALIKKTPDTRIKQGVTHSMIKRPSEKFPEETRLEVCGKLLSSGSFGFVFNGRGAVHENNLTFYKKPADKKRIIKAIPLKKESESKEYNQYRSTQKQIIKEAYRTQQCDPDAHCKKPVFDDDFGYIIMRKAPGYDLMDFIIDMRKGKFTAPPAYLVTVMLNIMVEVAKIHKRGWIIRDLKPENIIINPDTLEIKIRDFATALPISKKTCKSIKGTYPFIPPETRYLSKISPAIDIYALGIIFFELFGYRKKIKESIINQLRSLNPIKDNPFLFMDDLSYSNQIYLIDLFKSFIHLNPADRISLDQAIPDVEDILQDILNNSTEELSSSAEELTESDDDELTQAFKSYSI